MRSKADKVNKFGIFLKIKTGLLLITGLLTISGAAYSTESDRADCSYPGDSSELFEDNIQISANEIVDTDSALVQNIEDEQPCYCDIRKQ